jgi:hypothetical protein
MYSGEKKGAFKRRHQRVYIHLQHATMANSSVNQPLLPQYNQHTDHDDAVPDSWREFQSAPSIDHSVYPPRQVNAAAGTRPNVNYVFTPQYPLKGARQSALGVVGFDKEVG